MRKIKYEIVGSGASRLSALSLVRDEVDDFVMLDGGSFDTTCARVDCMPSKALIHSAINLLFEALYSQEERGIFSELTVMP